MAAGYTRNPTSQATHAPGLRSVVPGVSGCPVSNGVQWCPMVSCQILSGCPSSPRFFHTFLLRSCPSKKKLHWHALLDYVHLCQSMCPVELMRPSTKNRIQTATNSNKAKWKGRCSGLILIHLLTIVLHPCPIVPLLHLFCRTCLKEEKAPSDGHDKLRNIWCLPCN